MSHKKKVLVIGDSISIGYAGPAQAALGAEYVVAHNEGNAADSRHLLSHLNEYLAADSDAAMVYFNCGLHDIKSASPGQNQVSLERYVENLRAIIAMLKAAGRHIVYATTTPVDDERHYATHKEFHRYNCDVLRYNAAAREIMAAAGVAIDDLHAVVIEAGVKENIRDDGVHMTEAGYRILGSAVAGTVLRLQGSLIA